MRLRVVHDVSRCAVLGCSEPVSSRHLCERHYRSWAEQRLVDEAGPDAGELRYDANVPLVCICEQPRPDGLGMCTACGRLIVTFAHACREAYREAYPVEWARAEGLGMVPTRRESR